MASPAEPLLDGPVRELVAAVRSRTVTAVEVASASLRRVREASERLGAFLHVARDEALARAALVDRRATAGEEMPLAGVPLAVKDNINVAGLPSTAGSRILAGFVAPDDSTCVERLVRAGAVVVGKLNTHEFAFGAMTTSRHFGPARNPWDTERSCGGSSGVGGAAPSP